MIWTVIDRAPCAGTVVIAAWHTWRELWADGSHPLTDPLWSIEATAIVRHGRDAKRWQKLAVLAEVPGALDILRVCWQDHRYNCGQCEKCLRTMVLLRILGLERPTFPPLKTLRRVVYLSPPDRSEACFVAEARNPTTGRGELAVAGPSRSSLRRSNRRRFAGDFKGLLVGAVRRD